MEKLYGTKLCQDCVDVIEYLDKIGYKYEFVDITENINKMKEFIKIRDKREEYNIVKVEGYIGIPTLIKEDGTLLFENEIMKLK